MDEKEAAEVLAWVLEQVKEGKTVTFEPDWADGEHYPWTLDVQPEKGAGWHTHCHIFEPTLDESVHALWEQTVEGGGLSRVESPTCGDADED